MKIFYRLDGSRATFREYAFSTSWLLMPLVALIKLLRLQLPCSSDDPPVETLAPFEIDAAELPEEVRGRFAPLTGELAALGFSQPIYHQIYCPLQHTYLYWATFLHASGRAVARIHHRVWSQGNIHKSYLFPVFLSEMDDDSFVVSSAGKPDWIAPRSVHVEYQVGASAAELWQVHERSLDERFSGRPTSVNGHDRLRQLIERHHAALRDFHLERGLFKPVSEARQAELASHSETTLALTPPSSVETEVLDRLERMQTQRPGWWNFILVLGISLLAFLGAGLKDMDRQFLWLLVPILLFHELGHYVAMRLFGYRNLRMFFIPFFGAAVSGKHYNVPGWKKAVVALAGPVPGIAVGAGLGIAGMLLHQPRVIDAAFLMMILNGINLLPFMPLDGGWVLHALIFCRHPLLDMAFRVLAILAFFGAAFLIGGTLAWLAIFLLIGLPAAWHVASVAQRLRRREAMALSPDNVSIPPEAVRTILAELGAGRHSRTPANLLAHQVTLVFETLNARPPGILLSSALLTVHGGSFLAALVFAALFAVFRHGVLPDRLAQRPMPYRYTAASARLWQGAAAPASALPSSVTLVATYADEQAAQIEFARLRADLPRQASLCLFGPSVLLALPEHEDATRDQWATRLWRQAKNVVVNGKDAPLVFRFACECPGEQEAARLEEEFQSCFHFAEPGLLLPPWSAAWQALPETDRQRFQKARRTLGRLERVKQQAMRHPDARALAKQLPKMILSGDEARHREIMDRYDRIVKAEEERLLTELSAEGGATVDHSMMELSQRRIRMMKELVVIQKEPDVSKQKAKEEAWRRRLKALHREMAQRMGSLPLDGDNPRPGTDLETIGPGAYVQRKGLTLLVEGVVFRQVGKGLPALADWLGQHRAGEIRWDFEAMKADAADDAEP